ncbi:hypothetical protein UlMin_031794 [Ulmus minor]
MGDLGRACEIEKEVSVLQKKPELRKIRVLVVDDSMTNQMLHQRLLQILGIETLAVGNGKEAVDVHRSGMHFDLILMDHEMPVMNGIEATRQLREMGIRSTIAGVSSQSVGEGIQEFVKAGLDDYHEKPLNFAKLNSILQKVNLNG